MTSAEASERWQTYGTNYFTELRRLGLVAYDGETWTLTAASRAACPYRNPLLAAAPEGSAELPANVPEKSTMQGKTTVSNTDMLAAIKAAGPASTTAKALIKRFGCSETIVHNHIMRFSRAQEPVIFAALRHRGRHRVSASPETRPGQRRTSCGRRCTSFGRYRGCQPGRRSPRSRRAARREPRRADGADRRAAALRRRFQQRLLPSVEAAIASAAKNYEGRI